MYTNSNNFVSLYYDALLCILKKFTLDILLFVIDEAAEKKRESSVFLPKVRRFLQKVVTGIPVYY